MNYIKLFPCFILFLCLSCEADSYEKGEGEYSLTQADMADLTVDQQKHAVSFLTDDGAGYQLTNPFTAQWIATADTTYRTIIYYNKVKEGFAEVKGATHVVTLSPIPHWRLKAQPQDPVDIESLWLAPNGRYLNVALLLKTGRISDEELPHNVSLAQDTVISHTNGCRTVHYRLLHSQNGIPQYYTNRRYISILLPQPQPDTIHLTLQTYNGPLHRTISR
jgi:hypothetical protein